MRTIIKQIFGESKEIEKVSEDDIRKLINEWKIEESATLEYKSTEGLNVDRNGKLISKNEPEKCRKDKKEELLIKPLVAFLNKYQPEGGLLIWGINAKEGIPTELKAFQKGTIKREDIDRWISMSISSIPFPKDFPDVEIEEVEVDGKSVFLIEIHPRDFNTVYFSKMTNKVYRRRGKGSEEIPLPEIYKMIEEKIIAKVFLTLEVKKFESLENGKVRAEIKFLYFNEGCTPAEWIKSILIIQVIRGEETLKLDTTRIDALNSLNESPYVWNTEIKCPPKGLVFQIDKYFREVIYPHVPHEITTLIIEYNINTELKIRITTYEYKGRSRQIFTLLSGGILNEEIKEFHTYMI